MRYQTIRPKRRGASPKERERMKRLKVEILNDFRRNYSIRYINKHKYLRKNLVYILKHGVQTKKHEEIARHISVSPHSMGGENTVLSRDGETLIVSPILEAAELWFAVDN